MDRARISDFVELGKPRIVVLALLMSTLGYFLGSNPGEPIHWVRFLGMLIGTGLAGVAACAFNQYAEIEIDRRMRRTRNRPLPAGRLAPAAALKLGWSTAILGVMILAIFVNTTALILGAVTILTYIGLYTPAKPLSPVSTLIGAIPGALPPVIGWAAARDAIGGPGALLFGILFLWQIPHFLAIGWIYREDYSKAELPILTAVDDNGLLTSKQSVLYAIALLPLTLVPTLWGMAGASYFVGALGLGLVFLICAILLSVRKTLGMARLLFAVSIIYLPALGVLMLWDRLP